MKRALPTIIYLIVACWAMTPPSDRQASRMWWVRRRIQAHRMLAEEHGREVIRLENVYKEIPT